MTDEPPSPFRALAHAHLRTPTERAVFAVLAGSARNWWTVAGAARATGASVLDASQALRRFAAAGIVEHEVGVAGHRYRYRAEMDYLRGGVVDEGLRDPICGMPVAADTPHVAADDDGSVVRFCSVPCLTLWERGRRRDRGR